LPLTAVGSNPNRALDSFVFAIYPASLLNVGGSS
jgi:hypothetical protein